MDKGNVFSQGTKTTDMLVMIMNKQKKIADPSKTSAWKGISSFEQLFSLAFTVILPENWSGLLAFEAEMAKKGGQKGKNRKK